MPSISNEPSSRSTMSGVSPSSSGRSPASASSRSACVTMPSRPPYSSTTTASRTGACLKSSSTSKIGAPSWISSGSPTTAAGSSSRPASTWAKRSFLATTPTISSMLPRPTSSSAWLLSITTRRTASRSSLMSIQSTSVRGVMISAITRLPMSSVRATISCCASCSSPASWLSATISFSSLAECSEASPVPGFRPKRRKTRLPRPFNTVIAGLSSQRNRPRGRTTQRAVLSLRCRARLLGASSPSTICRAVMMTNESATAMAKALMPAKLPATRARGASIRWAIAGSPIQPSASDEMVMPS